MKLSVLKILSLSLSCIIFYGCTVLECFAAVGAADNVADPESDSDIFNCATIGENLYRYDSIPIIKTHKETIIYQEINLFCDTSLYVIIDSSNIEKRKCYARIHLQKIEPTTYWSTTSSFEFKFEFKFMNDSIQTNLNNESDTVITYLDNDWHLRYSLIDSLNIENKRKFDIPLQHKKCQTKNKLL